MHAVSSSRRGKEFVSRSTALLQIVHKVARHCVIILSSFVVLGSLTTNTTRCSACIVHCILYRLIRNPID